MNRKITRAIQLGLEQEVADLLREQPQLLEQRDLFGQTLLHLAVDRPGLVRLLLQAGASVEAADKEGQTPLHQAQNLESIQILLSHGAPPNAINALGATPLHRAVRRGPQALGLLLQAGADPQASSRGGETPLHWAAQGNYPEALDPLLQAGADLEATDDRGKTPLQTAVPQMVGELLRRGALLTRQANNPPVVAAPPAPAKAPGTTLRLGFVHSLRGKPEVHIVESPPEGTLGSLLEQLNYPADQLQLSKYPATASLFGSPRRFAPQDKVKDVAQILNPPGSRLWLEKYDDSIVIGRMFVFVRAVPIDAGLLDTLGLKPGDLIPRFGMAEAGYARLDQHLDPCARKAAVWQPHLNISPLRGVFGPQDPIFVVALCGRGSQKPPARAEIGLRDGGDYSLRDKARRYWAKEGLLLHCWPPNLRQALPRERVQSGSEKGDYQAMIEWGGQEARWVFRVGSFQRPKGKAEWVDDPDFKNGHWSGRIRLRAADGTTLPPGVRVKVYLDTQGVELATYLDGQIKLVELPDSPTYPYLHLNWRPRNDWKPAWDSRTRDEWQQLGMNETAILQLPRRDLRQQGPVLLSLQKFPGSQSVSGLEVALAPQQQGPLQLLAAVSEEIEVRATCPIQQAAVTVLDAQTPPHTSWLGPMAAGEVRKLDLSKAHGRKLLLCLGVVCGDQIHEEFFPVFRPPTLELHYQGPVRLSPGQTAQASFQVRATRGSPERVLILMQDARLGCPFQHDFKAREWTDLGLLMDEVHGQDPPLLSQAWLDATLQLKKKRGADLPPDCGPPLPERSTQVFLTGPPPTNPERRWYQWNLNQTLAEDFEPQPGLASLVKVSRGRAEFSLVAPTNGQTLAIHAFALDARGAVVTAQALVAVDPPKS